MKTTNLKNKLKTLLGIGALTLGLNANAQSVYTGLRGPTEFQFDNRTGYSERESLNGARTKTLTDNAILKYWNGTNRGIFAFVNLPYRNIQSEENESSGLGDLSLGAGPRFETRLGNGNLGIISSIGVSLPTGENNSSPTLGTGRTDINVGILGTAIDGAKKYEADFALNYALTEGNAVSDEVSGGIVLGGRLNPNFRLVAGALGNYKLGGANEGDNSLSGRINLRITPNGKLAKRFHFEIWYDQLLAKQGASSPKDSSAITLISRFNF
jgi:hypothetical protein